MPLSALLQGAGALMIALGLVHAAFPRYFAWESDLAPLQPINREMMKVHTLFIGLTVILIGLLALTSAEMLITEPLGHRVAGGIAFFWLIRLVVQWFGYSPELWRGKRFETAVHLVFTVLWTGLMLVFGAAAAAGG